MTHVQQSLNLLRGQLTTPEAFTQFLRAGHAFFTIRSRTTGTRFTYRAVRPDEKEHVERQAQYGSTAAHRDRPIWISVLTGPENSKDYSFLGTLWPEQNGEYRYAHSPKARILIGAESVTAVMWLAKMLSSPTPERIFEQAELWHEGRCGRCGRKLTVPESIETGFGPECSAILGL